MDELLVMKLLKRKGIITDKDLEEYCEATEVKEKSYFEVQCCNISEDKAKEIVANMYHYENHNKYIGEKYSMTKAKEIHEKYKNYIPDDVTCEDIYIAINTQYHNFVKLFKTWFSDNIDHKIIESAIVYWFNDEDCEHSNKVKHYFM
jgi:hypothetical protein